MSKILVAEDDAMLSQLLVHRLQTEGFETEAAYDGQEALAKIRSVHPDLVLLDILMPGKSGFDVLEEMRKDAATAAAKVVVLSNLDSEADIERAKSLGIVEFMVKARTTPGDVAKKIKEILGVH